MIRRKTRGSFRGKTGLTMEDMVMSALANSQYKEEVDNYFAAPEREEELNYESLVELPQPASIQTIIEKQGKSNSVLLYMKGVPQSPQCGFSAQTVRCLMEIGHRFSYVDVLNEPEIREALPAYAEWPTFPQLWVDGELIGGCDIVTEMFESGELKELLDEKTQ